MNTELGSMRVRVSVKTLLTALERNRAEHEKVVVEARAGYIDQAQKVIADKLEKLRSGRVTALSFDLRVPVAYTEDYDTAIGMLRMTEAPEVEITAAQYRCFVENKWAWARDFFFSNSRYSQTAAAGAASLGEAE